MVYCSKCGTKNEEDAKYCTKCGANLEVSREKRFERRAEEWGEDIGKRAERWGEQFGKRAEEECFGLPNGGAIAGIIWHHNPCLWIRLANRYRHMGEHRTLHGNPRWTANRRWRYIRSNS